MPRRLGQLKRLAASGNPTTLLTLTINPEHYKSFDAAARRLVAAWRLIRQQAKREGLVESIPFIAIFEATLKGWPHLHILLRAPYIPQAWLSQCMAKYAKSPIVDIRRVHSRRGAARYVAKYVSKGPGRFEGTKRYWCSRDWRQEPGQAPPEKDPRVHWEMDKRHPGEIGRSLLSVGFVRKKDLRNGILYELLPGATPLWQQLWWTITVSLGATSDDIQTTGP